MPAPAVPLETGLDPAKLFERPSAEFPIRLMGIPVRVVGVGFFCAEEPPQDRKPWFGAIWFDPLSLLPSVFGAASVDPEVEVEVVERVEALSLRRVTPASTEPCPSFTGSLTVAGLASSLGMLPFANCSSPSSVFSREGRGVTRRLPSEMAGDSFDTRDDDDDDDKTVELGAGVFSKRFRMEEGFGGTFGGGVLVTGGVVSEDSTDSTLYSEGAR